MKKQLGVLALSVGAITGAHAQSSLTIFGVMDAALSYQTHTNPAGSSTVAMGQNNEGFLSGSRIAFLGNEDLGNGWEAGFTLENGFMVDSGKLDQQGQLFGRQAFVRLGNAQYGEISLGRQYTTADTMMYYVDPLGIGAVSTNSWMVYLTGQRYDNSVMYTGTYGPVQMLAQYAMGEVAGSGRARSSASLGLKYAQGAVLAVADAQQTNDSKSRSADVYLVGVKLTFGNANLYANYLHSSRQGGFDASNGGTDTASIPAMSSGSPTAAVAINSVFASHRIDDFGTIAASYRLSPAWLLTLAGMYNHTNATDFSGSRATVYSVADYSLSKRTDVYVAAGYERVTGGWSGLFGNATTNANAQAGAHLNGRNEQVSVLAGLRHKF